MNTPMIVSATDLVRRFGYYSNILPSVDGILIVRDGKPLGTLVASWEQKREKFLKTAGSLKNTSFGDPKIWKQVFKRKSRKEPVII